MARRLADQRATDPCRRRSIERDRPEPRKIAEQMLDLIVFRLADRLVEAAAPARRSDDVPQADASLAQPLEPPAIIQRLQFLADRRA